MASSKNVAAVVADRVGRRRGSSIGVLAALALVAGYFLPWTPLTPVLEGSLELDRGVIARSVKRDGDQRKQAVSERLQRGEAISGNEWAAVLEAVDEKGGLDESRRRTVEAARVGVIALPFVAGALAVLLLLGSIPPARALKLGLGPVAGLMKLAQSRLLSGLLAILAMAFAAVVVFVGSVLWIGTKNLEETRSAAGLGIMMMTAGGSVALLSGFFGYGPGRLRALLWSALLVAILALVITIRLAQA